MELGLIVDPYDIRRTVHAAQLAERSGFCSFWLPDSPMLFQDAFVALAAVAGSTGTIRLGPCVTNPITRRPSTIADLVLTLDELSTGRVVLGLGRGDSAVRLIGAEPARLTDLESAVQVLRLDMARRRPRFPPVPIYLAASGPRTLRLAGALADGAIVTYGVTPSLVAEAREHVESGLRSAARGWHDFRFVLNVNCAFGNDHETPFEILPSVAAKVNYALARSSLTAREMDDVSNLRRAYQYGHHQASTGKQTKCVQPWMIERFAVVGTAAEYIERFRTVRALGVDEIIVDPGQGDVDEFVSRFSREVLPAFRDRSGESERQIAER